LGQKALDALIKCFRGPPRVTLQAFVGARPQILKANASQGLPRCRVLGSAPPDKVHRTLGHFSTRNRSPAATYSDTQCTCLRGTRATVPTDDPQTGHRRIPGWNSSCAETFRANVQSPVFNPPSWVAWRPPRRRDLSPQYLRLPLRIPVSI